MKLVTKRLILRDLTMKDAKDLVGNINDLNVSIYLTHVPYPYTKKDAREFISICGKNIKQKPRKNYELGIELKSEKKLVGLVSLIKVERFNGTAGIGYWLGQKYWRQGIMYEAVSKLIEFAFTKLKLRRLSVTAFKENEASNSLIKKIGFKKEGIRKEHYKSKATGKIHDDVIYGLLKSEWKK